VVSCGSLQVHDGLFHGGFLASAQRRITMGPPKRPSEELQHPGKLPKIEHGLVGSPLNETHSQHGDFSGSVKKRLANSSRTGQACDRCKVRKQKVATASRSIMVSHWQSGLRTSLATRLDIGF
jgi:hypothetical protein